MSFKDIKGEAAAVSLLKNAASIGRVASAYIFLGPSGCGRKLAALNFAKLLNCSSAADGEPCERCPSCVKINSSTHPDIRVLGKEESRSELGIDIVLEAIKSIGLKAYEAKRKVYIIDGADLMSEEASNAALKTLEETPGDSVMVLLIEDINSIPQTIRSRSQTVKFFPMPAKDIEAVLKKEHGMDGATAGILALLAQGSMGRAIEYSKNGFLDKRSRVLAGLRSGKIFNSDFDKMKRDDFLAYLDIMLTWYRDVLVTKACAGDAKTILNVDMIRQIGSDAAKFSYEYLDNAVRVVTDTRSGIESNANSKLAMSVLGIRLKERG